MERRKFVAGFFNIGLLCRQFTRADSCDVGGFIVAIVRTNFFGECFNLRREGDSLPVESRVIFTGPVRAKHHLGERLNVCVFGVEVRLVLLERFYTGLWLACCMIDGVQSGGVDCARFEVIKRIAEMLAKLRLFGFILLRVVLNL